MSTEPKRDALRMWFQTGAKFRLHLTDLNHRGVRDVLIACLDGLKGFLAAIEAVAGGWPLVSPCARTGPRT
jgi:putative transposase